MNRREAEAELAGDLAETFMATILDAFPNEDGGALINIELAVESLLSTTAYLLALRPDLDTPQRVRFCTLNIAKALAERVQQARQDQEEKRLHQRLSVQTVVLS